MKNEENNIAETLRKIYLEILERDVDNSGLDYYYNKLLSKEYNFNDVEKILKNSKEYLHLQNQKKELSEFQKQIQKPIFIIGVPRSGTTLIYNILGSHKELAWLSYTDIDFYLSLKQKRFLKQKWKSMNEKIPIDEATLYVFGRRLGKRLKHFGHVMRYPEEIPIEGEVFLKSYFGTNYIKDISLSQKIELSKEIIKIIERKNKKRFLNKAPQNCIRLFALQKCFPDAKFINICRNPIAVISSMYQRFNEEGAFDTGIPIRNNSNSENLDFLQKCINMYKEIVESVKKFELTSKDSNFKTVFYEKLTKNPIEESKKIFEFCELEISESLKEMIPKISVTSKISLSNQQQQKITQTLGPVIKELGLPY